MISRALTFLLIIATCAWAGPTRRPSAYAAWKYARPCSVKVEIASLMRYVVVPRASGDTMQADYDDIRFADDNGRVLYHWLKDTVADTARIWLGLDTVYENSRVWCYSGNATAASASNCAAAFNPRDTVSFGDDFEPGRPIAWNDHLLSNEVTVSATDGENEAWPSLTGNALRDTLVIAYRHTDTTVHVMDSGGAAVYKISLDSGATWLSEDTLHDTPNIDDRDVDIQWLDSSGTSIWLAVFHTKTMDGYSRLYCVKSHDLNTWTDTIAITPDEHWQSKSNITMLSTGRVLITGYTSVDSTVAIFATDDFGDSWSKIGSFHPPADTFMGEVSLLETFSNGLYTGGLLAIARLGPLAGARLCRSTDYGVTWGAFTNPGWKTQTQPCPFWPVRLRNGRIVVYYGYQTGYSYWSMDEGYTWTKEAGNWFSDASVSRSYPSAIEMDSGKILIAYCTNKNESDIYLAHWMHTPSPRWRATADSLKMIAAPDTGKVIRDLSVAKHCFSTQLFDGSKTPIIYNAYIRTVDAGRLGFYDDNFNAIGTEVDGGYSTYALENGDAARVAAGPNETQYFELQIVWTADTIDISVDGTHKYGKNAAVGNGICTGNHTVHCFVNGAADYVYYDWVTVRPYTATIPTVTLGAYGASMTLDSISPATGTASGGDTVRWYGTGFTPTTGGLTLAGVAVTVVAWTDTLVTTVSGAGTAGTGDAVLTDAGSNTATIASGWTYSGAGTTTSIYHWLFGWMRGWFGR